MLQVQCPKTQATTSEMISRSIFCPNPDTCANGNKESYTKKAPPCTENADPPCTKNTEPSYNKQPICQTPVLSKTCPSQDACKKTSGQESTEHKSTCGNTALKLQLVESQESTEHISTCNKSTCGN